jgi:hypothetical protein
MTETYIITRPLTRELDDTSSPVRQFLGDRFTAGLRGVQRRYREAAPPLTVPPAPPGEANPGTTGTAADWLVRFLVHPRPALHLAAAGSMFCNAQPALEELATMLGMTGAALSPGQRAFDGPVPGNGTESAQLARACWALALLTEVYRAGPAAALAGPLAPFAGPHARPPSAAELLALGPAAGLSQLALFREVFGSVLLPALAGRRGLWAIGPTFTGSALMNADADLIAAGLLLDLKTSRNLTLGVKDILQVIGYALLDFDDEFGVDAVGIFAARYAYLATWDLASLLNELAGRPVSLAETRSQFRELLVAHHGPASLSRQQG